ncbi:MAG TPA: hypothetical protein VFU21_04700 [Kofleriaceae bacterium]|nr:hypothetical protein [Kofleriaceae bacterium]
MRILVPVLVLAASGCDFGDNRPLPAAGCVEPDGCADGGGPGSETDASDDGGGGDAAPDEPDAAPAEACTLVAPQTGCPAGTACDLDDAELETGGTTCRPIDDDGDERSLCDGERECGAGFTCVEDPAGEASCLRFCDVESDCADPGGSCEIELEDAQGHPIPNVSLCTQSCNPVSSSGCPPSWGCQLFTDHTRCRPSGTGRHMDVCTGDEDCAVGFGCATVGADRFCLRNCRVGVVGPCSAIAGTTCVGYQTPVIIGGVEYGACF